MRSPADACVVGQPGVGKTLFVLRFARWCGHRRLVVHRRYPEAANGEWVEMDPSDAVARLVGMGAPTTRHLQHLDVEWRHAKRQVTVRLVDTVGLTPEVHPDPGLRRSMAETLALVMESRIVLHMVDGPALAKAPERLLDEDDLDARLARYGERRGGYAVLVNKLDLPGGRAGLESVRRAWPRRTVLGISALEAWGFDAVRRFLQRRL